MADGARERRAFFVAEQLLRPIAASTDDLLTYLSRISVQTKWSDIDGVIELVHRMYTRIKEMVGPDAFLTILEDEAEFMEEVKPRLEEYDSYTRYIRALRETAGKMVSVSGDDNAFQDLAAGLHQRYDAARRYYESPEEEQKHQEKIFILAERISGFLFGYQSGSPDEIMRIVEELQSVSLTTMPTTVIDASQPPARRRHVRDRDTDTTAPADRGERFDVFLCHNSKDKPAVRELAVQLTKRRLRVWLDEDQIPPGTRTGKGLEEGVNKSASALVLVGGDGLGPWQSEEQEALIKLSVEQGLRVIPVLLPDAPTEKPKLPLFLGTRTYVDLRDEGITKATLDKLQWGITGIKPE